MLLKKILFFAFFFVFLFLHLTGNIFCYSKIHSTFIILSSRFHVSGLLVVSNELWAVKMLTIAVIVSVVSIRGLTQNANFRSSNLQSNLILMSIQYSKISPCICSAFSSHLPSNKMLCQFSINCIKILKTYFFHSYCYIACRYVKISLHEYN